MPHSPLVIIGFVAVIILAIVTLGYVFGYLFGTWLAEHDMAQILRAKGKSEDEIKAIIQAANEKGSGGKP